MPDKFYDIELTGNSPITELYKNGFRSDPMQQSLYIVYGKVTGITGNGCDGPDLELVPVFDVSHWTYGAYDPILAEFSVFGFALYTFFAIISIIYFIKWLLFKWRIKKIVAPGSH